MSANLRIAAATERDLPLILRFIRSLAEYERLSDHMVATEGDLREALFGPQPVAWVLLAYWADEPAGFALYFLNFSTFLGKPGIYLEDLFVEPALRGKGIGKALLVRLAEIARERGYGRLEWSVLDWNRPAIDFYRSLGAEAKAEWTTYRLSGERLKSL
jgi:GNAT superfamily N-acetyltransferase